MCTNLIESEYSLKQNFVREVYLLRYGHPSFYRYKKYSNLETSHDEFARAAVLACKESYSDFFNAKAENQKERKLNLHKEATEICANHLTRYRSPGREEYPIDAWLRHRRALVSKHMAYWDSLKIDNFQSGDLGY